MRRLPPAPLLYVIVDPDTCAGRGVVDVARAAEAGGAGLIQLRSKNAGARDLIDAARALKAALTVPVIVNDRADVALAAGADGAHLGQGDLPPAAARAILGPGAIIGATAFVPAHMAALDPQVVDYAGTGPVFPTPTKLDKPVLGVAEFAALARLSPVPVVAIGGIAEKNAAPPMAAGAAGVAVMRAVGQAPDPASAARALRRAIA